MLAIRGKPIRLCDGMSRRAFLQVGSLALGGLSLPQLLRAEDAQGIKRSHKAVIMVFLPGGPPHQDMFDLKMNAPAEIRGEFMPIDTNVPGIQICELFPRLAGMMDKLAIIRSLVGAQPDHVSFQCLTGHAQTQQPPGGWPALGSVLSKVQGPVDPSIPPSISLAYKTQHAPWGDPGPSGFLGSAHAPFQPNGAGKADMVLQGVTLERLRDRRKLLASFDNFRRDADASGLMAGLDAYNEQAFGVLTSSKLVEALDLSRENPKIVERYGKGDPEPEHDGAPRMMEDFLVARRLVEAGARCVTISFARWDWHVDNFGHARRDFPMLDQGLSALIADLHERGLDKDVSVVVWGEFGRTPKINNEGGRDHWPNVSCALLAGGGMRTGQVIGRTTRYAEEVADRPIHFQDVFATLYSNLGLDTRTLTAPDLSGRPRYMIDNDKYSAIRELV